jgi:serralysin
MASVFEDTDAAAGTGTIYEMEVGDDFYGQILNSDEDWVAVTLQAGTTYSFGAVGVGAMNSGVSDPLLILRNSSGFELARNDDGGPGLTSSVTFTATSTDTYYVHVKAFETDGDGLYGVSVVEGGMPSYGALLGSAVLYRGGTSWASAPETGVTLTWGVRASGPATDADGRSAPFSQLTAAQTAAVTKALANYTDVADLHFTRVNETGTTNNATILVGAYTSTTDGAGAYAMFPGSTGAVSSDGDLWLNNDGAETNSLPIGSYEYFTCLHELGHAMGLDHPGDYNAAFGVEITYENSAQFMQDSNQYSVMSYFAATDTEPDAPDTYCDTLMMYDILAIQQLYGTNTAARAGNTTYGFHATVGGAYDFTVNDDPLMCIWDGAGRDTIDLSGFRADQVIDLHGGSFSDVGGYKGNLSIAVGARIESAVGGSGADEIYGNEFANKLRGGAGTDVLVGDLGNDTMQGGGGADGFVFIDGYGRDKVLDFSKVVDILSLGSDLWGGTNLTKQQVLNRFAHVTNGDLVFNFGDDVITLLNVHSKVGMLDNILLS